MQACRDCDENIVNGDLSAGQQNSYVNFTFTVSTGTTPQNITRSGEKPAGGENGDGREAGFERENAVTGVTLIFYQNPDGINATASSTPALSDTKVKLVKYFPVRLESRDTQGTIYNDKQDEAHYTTGNQKIEKTDGLDLKGKYRVLVIANVNLTTEISAGNELSVVRDKVYSAALYSGTGLMSNATNFIMTSENDVELNFLAEGVKSTVVEGSSTKDIYSFTGLRVERMAARIDFSTQYNYKEGVTDKYGADYKTQDKSSHDYLYPGYVYPVYKSTDSDGNPTSPDRFVVTAIVPFNLSLTNTGGSEYLFKRVDNSGTISYLTDEAPSWVIDPNRSSKTSTTEHPTYFDNNLAAVEATMSATDPHTALANLGVTTASYQTSSAKYSLAVSGTNTADNLIIAYPKENTLLPDSRLYYYATGIAIEGYYYPNDDATQTPTRYVYVGYLRHNGEDAFYSVEDLESLDKSKTCKTGQVMNFGVVRNNIYRISINKVNEKSALELSIKVKNWDKFTHDIIYM